MAAGFFDLSFTFGFLAAPSPTEYGTLTYWFEDTADTRRIVFSWMTAPGGGLSQWMNHDVTGELVQLETAPMDSPTDNYDIQLIDTLGSDALYGLGANRDTANVEMTPLLVASSSLRHLFTEGPHRFVVSNAGGQREGVTILTMRRTV